MLTFCKFTHWKCELTEAAIRLLAKQHNDRILSILASWHKQIPYYLQLNITKTKKIH